MDGMPEFFLANLIYIPGSEVWFWLRKVSNEEGVGKEWMGRSVGRGLVVFVFVAAGAGFGVVALGDIVELDVDVVWPWERR